MPGIQDIWLYANNIIRSSRQILNESLKPLKLSSAEGNILLHLFTQQQPFPQERLVEELDISKPAVSRALKSLERKGYIQRQKDAADKRASLIFLTEKAFNIGPQVEQVYNNVYALAANVVTAEEVEAFIHLFKRVSESFTAAQSNQKQRRNSNNVE